jgi:hypothetical protein
VIEPQNTKMACPGMFRYDEILSTRGKGIINRVKKTRGEDKNCIYEMEKIPKQYRETTGIQSEVRQITK